MSVTSHGADRILREQVALNAAIAFLVLAAIVLVGRSAFAGEADVLAVATREHAGIWRFDVTVRHDDAGWDHYADRFEIVAPDGTVLGTRTLLHPHDDEQPFTRSLDGVVVPPDLSAVTVRAHDRIHGFGGREENVPLR